MTLIKMESRTTHAAPSSSPLLLPDREIPPSIIPGDPVNVNEYFYGRQEHIQYVRDRLLSAVECPSVICIHGMPGMGKTQLAARYRELFAKQYHADIWVEVSTRECAETVLSYLAIKLKLAGASVEAEPGRNAQLMISWLKTTEKPWLLIFDNLVDAQCLRGLWPIGGNGHIIITSRNPYASEYPGSKSLNLPPLSQNESRDLFYKVCGIDRERQHNEEMKELLEEWNGLPLALYHIGSYIRRAHLDIGHFLNLYRQAAARIHQTKFCADRYPHTIATAFSTRELFFNLKTTLAALCYFDPASIPNDLLSSNFDDGQPLIQVETEFEYVRSCPVSFHF
ncbi:hypothetical protein Hte_010716 [Hypoxylon texense]